MQVYLVGGAVRDELLGRPVLERDWVVVGATPEQMLRLGYRSVGQEFPVFLHPRSGEEYALARLERKTGPGYRGFATEFSPGVTLEQDLRRRDLTINAMARSPEGALIDPYGGRSDLEQRRLRHVSAAFVEDPVRVLRVARFAARFADLQFEIAPQTLALMRAMSGGGELDALVPERVWREMERALAEASPEAFFDTLESCAALPAVLPELCWDAASRAALRAAVPLERDVSVRFAALAAGSPIADIERLCARLRAPGRCRELALMCAALAGRLTRTSLPDAAGLLELLEQNDALRRPERFHRLLLSVGARVGNLEGLAMLREAAAAAAPVALEPERLRQLDGRAIADALRRARLERIGRLQSERRRS
jgi:tRNA nucleotidyltransferase (CCA-adding enzyme)